MIHRSNAASVVPLSSPGRRPDAGDRQPPGFTLVEVLVALTLLAASLLVVAQLMVVAARAGDASREASLATALAAQKIDQLRTLAWGVEPDGTLRTDLESDVAYWPARPSGGAGLSLSPPGSLAADTAGYVDYLDANGRWVGAGVLPPGPAVFARRWAVEAAHPACPATLILRAAVWRRTPAWAVAFAGAPAWVPMLELASAKARRGG
jgi:prepilin-type N-terminal cleavage/methylation domain-containing protein